MSEQDIVRQFTRLPDLVNSNPALVRRGRYLSDTFLVGVGETPIYVTVRDGRVEDLAVGAALMRSWAFAIRADADAWTRFWEPVSAPGYHDLLAMARFGSAVIEGDLRPLMANLRYVKEVLAAPRQLAEAGA